MEAMMGLSNEVTLIDSNVYGYKLNLDMDESSVKMAILFEKKGTFDERATHTNMPPLLVAVGSYV